MAQTKIKVISNRTGGAIHPLDKYMLKKGDVCIIDIFDKLGNFIYYKTFPSFHSAIRADSIEILSTVQKFIYLDQIKYLPDNCYCRSKIFW